MSGAALAVRGVHRSYGGFEALAGLDLKIGSGECVAVIGRNGSGKTTTLYTGLLALNSIARKIITIEDPIEYQLHGINQIQVQSQIGLTFARRFVAEGGRVTPAVLNVA